MTPRRRRRRREPAAAAAVLARFRRRGGGAPSGAGAQTAAAALAWPDVVGRAAADHSVPVRRTRAGVLTVACSDASWAHELTARRADLAARLARRCPEAAVTALRFAVADHVVPAPAPAPAPAPPPAVPGPADLARGAAAAEGVREPALRDLVARAAAASAARRRPR